MSVAQAMRYVVDTQGFWQPGNRFVLKELAVIPLDRVLDFDPRLYSYLFKPPYPWRRLTQKYQVKNTWLIQNYHGLKWDSGDFLYSDIPSILKEQLSDATTVYVDGEDRKQWLEELCKKSIMNIRELGFDTPSRSVVTVCAYHKSLRKVVCALHQAKLMRDYALHNLDTMEWEDISDWT